MLSFDYMEKYLSNSMSRMKLDYQLVQNNNIIMSISNIYLFAVAFEKSLLSHVKIESDILRVDVDIKEQQQWRAIFQYTGDFEHICLCNDDILSAKLCCADICIV